VYVTHDQTEAMTLGDRVAVMRAGILQQVDAPSELYDRPANIFVAGFIGSPAMNFFAGSIDGESIRTPMGAIPLSDAIRRKLESHGTGSRNVIVGIRPEDFEDAEYAPEGHAGWTFEAPIELTESMGAEIYAHFDFDQAGELESEELRELQEDAGTGDVPQSSSGHAVARVDAASGVTAGQRSKLWLDTEKIHLFDPADGHSLTRGSRNGAAAVA
jgi:multiple sugar transport system ATP-binding protein